MTLISCEINLFLTWSKKIFITADVIDGQVAIFLITDTKLVPAVTLSTYDNAKLLQQWKTGFKNSVNWDNINQKQQYRHENEI